MKFQIISIFPEMFAALTDYGVVGRAIRQGLVSLDIHNPRDFTKDKHATVDGRPYGGGPGMVMLAEPLDFAIQAARAKAPEGSKVVYLTPAGEKFSQSKAQSILENKGLILLSGRYEGIDERVIERSVDEQWSLGDFVMSGGEIAAMAMVDTITRLIPDSLGNQESAKQDSFSSGLLEHPQYARPEDYQGHIVPPVLMSGDHAEIAKWRRQQALARTWLRRPELLEECELDEYDSALLEAYQQAHRET